MVKNSTFRFALLGAVLVWAALPPAGFWPLAWIAPASWVMLIRREKLDGPRPYAVLTLICFIFWMAALHWLRLPYWAVGFGWAALSFYFAFYLPVFIGLSRIAVHQLRVPVILAAPIVWTGLELARAHLLTGMSMASLAHTQYRWVGLIQISDLAGAYGVSFVVMFVAACIARALPCESRPRAIWAVWPAAAIMAAVLGYGYARTAGNITGPGPRIALIQGCIDSTVGGEDRHETMFNHYLDLSRQAVDKYGQLDLIIWPETYFLYPLITYDADAGSRDPRLKGSGISADEALDNLKKWDQRSRQAFAGTAAALRAPMIVGLDAHHFSAGGERVYNSAVYLSKTGQVLGRYDKMHLVMFGEYIPLADRLTWLYDLTPLTVGATPGTKPTAFQVQGIRISPNICYEDVLPHVIRGQINTLQAQGLKPDALVNLTNDGWFWGSSELDMHLACAVFRAVEFRKPLLIAANTGFSAWIDADGRIVEQGPRHAPATILANVRVDRRRSWYLYYGDWPAGICLVCCGVFAAAGCWKHFRQAHNKLLFRKKQANKVPSPSGRGLG